MRSLRIELVLTAHPTEMVRRTLLQTHRRIADLLAVRDRPDLTPEESDAAIDDLRREIATVWQTERSARSRRSRRSTKSAAASPCSSRRCGRRCRATCGRSIARSARPLPLDAAPLRFGSWIGGDRDGNPNVTPEVTRKAAWMARWMAADLYAREIDALRAELSIAAASDELRAGVGDAHEPYRALLRDVAARLRATRAYAAARDRRERRIGDRSSGAPFLDGRRNSRRRCCSAIARSSRPATR